MGARPAKAWPVWGRPSQYPSMRAVTLFAQAEGSAGTDLPQFVEDEFNAFHKCSILAHCFLRLHCGDFGHDKHVAFCCKRRGFASHAVSGAWRSRLHTW